MALWIAAWALTRKSAAAKAEEGEGGVAVTTQPKPKEPETIQQKTKSNVQVSWVIVILSICCCCTLPTLVCALPAAILATEAQRKAEAGEEEQAESLNKTTNALLGCSLLAFISLFVVGVFILPWLIPVIYLFSV